MMRLDPRTGLWLPGRPRLCSMFPAIHGVAGAAAGALYVADAVDFDNTNDYLTRGAGLTGAVDGKQCTFSVWFKTSGAGSDRILDSTNGRIQFYIVSISQRFFCIAQNASGSEILQLNTSSSGHDDGVWHHLIVSFDLTDTGKRHLYFDDVTDLDIDTYTDDDIDFTVADWSVGADTGGSLKWPGCLADLWFEDTYIDLSIEANRRKFIDASGKPVDLGSDGSTPTGASPLIFLSGPTVNWHTNKGTGGGFTENGALTDCADSPSD